MVLFATQRSEDGEAATSPVATYTEILELANAAYVAQHLHHHLKTRLGLDVWLPTGFCSAVRIASFIATSVDRPEAFSLFACGPQPLAKKSSSGTDANTETADELMRMQLKISDSTTGLSDKDVKRLTQVRHTVPRDFRELAGLLENMSGVTELIFGPRSPITTMLGSWVHFLTRTGGTTVAHLRQIASMDATMPSRLGPGNSLSMACSSSQFVRTSSRNSEATTPWSQGEGTGRGGTSGRSGYADDVVTNPHGRLVKITSKDNWQTFVDHASEGPIPNLCCRYHLNGKCVKSCFHAHTHVALTEEQKAGLTTWVAKCRSRMRAHQDDGDNKSKKSKLVNRDHAYSMSTPRTPQLVVDNPSPSRSMVAPSHEAHRKSHMSALGQRSSPQGVQRSLTPTRRSSPPVARIASPAAKSPAALMHASRLAITAPPSSPRCSTDAYPPRSRVIALKPLEHAAASYQSTDGQFPAGRD
ncbi:hypothetical protein MHU86_4635 [Fragilaria crotonensis]|nr:hypothetical protein MHU86_4635 [Fragilaria crotonensis]